MRDRRDIRDRLGSAGASARSLRSMTRTDSVQPWVGWPVAVSHSAFVVSAGLSTP
ncbi:hypothetical protein ACIQGO_12755 [Streptomyces shenzhenensis]|uniref:hypothetical protein n=1 Tax=Streptomyces shenzhenensis TaxID=943815 RepID=UPI00381D6269